jgi:replicative DNA helicase
VAFSGKTLADTLKERLNAIKGQLERRAQGEVVNPFVPTGLRAWDENGGILRGILTVIGAATGEGKSIVKLQLARGAAKSLHRVCMIDFEDPKEKTADRVYSGVTGIDNRVLGLLKIEDLDVRRLDAAIAEVTPWAEFIEHHVGLLSTERCLEIMDSTEADIILVDYAQAFPEDDDTTMERTIARFAWAANELAQRKNKAIVVFSQIVRGVEERGYRIFERAKFRDPDRIDVSGFAPGGLSDVAWAKSLGERAKELLYIWRENRIARKLGARVEDNRLRIIPGKVNFGYETDLVFEFDGPTATIRDLPRKK